MFRKRVPQDRVEEVAKQLKIVEPFKDTGYDWRTAKPDVKAPNWSLEPQPKNNKDSL